MKDDGASLIEAHAATPASRGQFGVFEVERLLGEGAFSEVYLARRPGGGAPVAVKVLREDVDPRVKEQVRLRFLSEERIAKAIGHRAVVDVVETGCTPGGRFFIVMEYVDGQPFGEYFDERGRAEEASGSTLGRERLLFELARIGHQVAEAMASAHQRGVVHRDLKSENVLVATAVADGELPRARILDFGIAKAPCDVFSVSQARSFTRYFTDLGTVMGSPPYMAPEQNGAAHAVTGKADVYALGVMLFIAALRLDHRAIEAFQLPLVLPDEFERLVQSGAPLPKPWRELLRAMLRLEAEERPSMHEVALRLQRLARPDVDFAAAVERFTRYGRLPSARRMCAFAARMEREAYLTDDERSFLRVAPIEKLRSVSSPVTRVALLTVTGALCFAAGSLGVVPGASLRSFFDEKPGAPVRLAANVAAPPAADGEKQRLSAELERARVELARHAASDKEQAAALTACSDKLARCESNAERAGERSRTLATELEEKANAVGRAQREADAEAETASTCQRELAAKTQELAESADRLRLCTRSLREMEDGTAPKVLGLSR
jgi:tRNA A-37 threonylcarbamoyl transferase component Bud32